MNALHGAVDPTAERELLEQMSIEEPWALLETFNGLVRESGSEDERRAFDFLEGRLKAFGVPYKRFEPTLYISVPKAASLRVTAPEPHEVRVKSVSFSASTGPAGREGELVYTGGGQAKGLDDFFDVNVGGGDVRGKIALCEGFALPSKIDALERAGAVAQIYINPGKRIHDSMASPVWGSPGLENRKELPKTPILSVNNPDGKALAEACQAGAVRVALSTELDEGWKPLPVLEATVGGGESDEFVLAHGHVDSWGVGIGDNAVGNATLLELARVFQQAGGLKRALKLCWWPGHSTGRYAGSAWYADEFAQEIDQHCIAQVNVDSPGCRWATAYEDVLVMPEAEGFCARAIRDVSGQEASFMRPLRAGDYSFNNIGVSSFYMLLSTIPAEEKRRRGLYPVGGCGGNVEWHTEADTLEIADRDNLLRDLKVYAVSLRRALNCEVYPFDYRVTVARMTDALAEYKAAAAGAGVELDFARAEGEFDRLSGALERFYDGLEGMNPAAANAALLALSRDLVPLDHTTSPRFQHDPAMPRPALPALAQAKALEGLHDDEKRFAQVDLRQALNGVAGAVRRARIQLEQSSSA